MGQPLLPDVPNWAWHEYGMRVGFWRFIDVLGSRGREGHAGAERHRLPLSTSGLCGGARRRLGIHGARARAGADAQDRRPARVDHGDDRQAIRDFTGRAPRGWESPGLTETRRPSTISRKAGIEYVCNWPFDDLPVEMQTKSGPIVSLPYPVEVNDVVISAVQQQPSDEIFRRGRDTFDRLYEEGEKIPRIMAISISPLPHRRAAPDQIPRGTIRLHPRPRASGDVDWRTDPRLVPVRDRKGPEVIRPHCSAEEAVHDYQMVRPRCGGCCVAGGGVGPCPVLPNRPIRIIVPFASGSGPDVLARLIGNKIADRLRQSVVVEGKPGASGQIGMDAVAKARPDGYTIGVGVVTNLTLAPHTYKKLPYDPLKDFVPVALATTNYLALVTRPDAPFKTVREIIAWAKANPGKLNVGTGGTGDFTHMSFELLAHLAGFKFLNVPYNSSGTMTNDLMGGRIDVSFFTYTGAAQLIDTGRLRLLGITSPVRDAKLPELPTIGEAIEGYGSMGWFGFVVPAGTSTDIVNKLNEEINLALQQPDVRTSMTTLGLLPVIESSGVFREAAEDRKREVRKAGPRYRLPAGMKSSKGNHGRGDHMNTATRGSHEVTKPASYEPFGWHNWHDDFWMSYQFRRGLGETQEGGGAVSEVFQAGSKITPNDFESWYREWTPYRQQRSAGRRRVARKHVRSAMNCSFAPRPTTSVKPNSG